MVTPIEIGLLVVALIGLYVAFKLLKNAKALAVNAIVGLVVLVAANLLGVGVEISLLAVLICAVAGLPGAILVVLLALLDVAFAAIVAVPLA
jgi:hypothetical protein